MIVNGETTLINPGAIFLSKKKLSDNTSGNRINSPEDYFISYKLSSEKFVGWIGDFAEYGSMHFPDKAYYNNIPRLELLTKEEQEEIGYDQATLDMMEKYAVITNIGGEGEKKLDKFLPKYFGTVVDKEKTVMMFIIPPGYKGAYIFNGSDILSLGEYNKKYKTTSYSLRPNVEMGTMGNPRVPGIGGDIPEPVPINENLVPTEYPDYILDNYNTHITTNAALRLETSITGEDDYYRLVKIAIVPSSDPIDSWDAEIEYEVDEVVEYNSEYWKSLVSGNLNHTPEGGSEYWIEITKPKPEVSVNFVNLGYRTSENPYKNLDKYLLREEGFVPKYEFNEDNSIGHDLTSGSCIPGEKTTSLGLLDTWTDYWEKIQPYNPTKIYTRGNFCTTKNIDEGGTFYRIWNTRSFSVTGTMPSWEGKETHPDEIPKWNSNEIYVIGELVRVDSAIFKSMIDLNDSNNPTAWKEIEYSDSNTNWNSSSEYSKDNVVLYNNKYWRSQIDENSGNIPDAWRENHWNKDTSYSRGEYVRYDRRTYKSLIEDNLGNKPTSWNEILKLPPAYTTGVEYNRGDKVRYNSKFWVSMMDENSNVEPGIDERWTEDRSLTLDPEKEYQKGNVIVGEPLFEEEDIGCWRAIADVPSGITPDYKNDLMIRGTLYDRDIKYYYYRGVYNRNEMVYFNENYWTSLIDNNTRNLPGISEYWKIGDNSYSTGDLIWITIKHDDNKEDFICGTYTSEDFYWARPDNSGAYERITSSIILNNYGISPFDERTPLKFNGEVMEDLYFYTSIENRKTVRRIISRNNTLLNTLSSALNILISQ